MQYRSIEFAEDIGSTIISFDDDEGAEISSTHLVIERLLDLCVSK